MNRHASQADRLLATVAWPGLHRIGAAIDDRHLGRPRQHPLAAHLAYGAAVRIYRSCLAADRELAAGNLWARLIETYNTTADRLGHATMPARTPVMSVHRYRWARDLLTEPDNLDTLLDAYTAEAVTLARTIGLLDPNGPGSLTHPHRSRIIYGDGTVVRPLYQPDRTKKKTTTAARRADPDAATFHRHDGPIHGNNLVAICARGDAPHERVVLAVGRVDEPGREADCALELIGQVVHHAGTGIQAVVYDGALRGVHIEQLMTRHGLIVINKVPAAAGGKDRELALGTFEHQPPAAAAPAATSSSPAPDRSSRSPPTTPATSSTPARPPADRSNGSAAPVVDGASVSASPSPAATATSPSGSPPTPNPATPPTDAPRTSGSLPPETTRSPAATGSATTAKASTARTSARCSSTAPTASAGAANSSTSPATASSRTPAPTPRTYTPNKHARSHDSARSTSPSHQRLGAPPSARDRSEGKPGRVLGRGPPPVRPTKRHAYSNRGSGVSSESGSFLSYHST